MNQQTMADTTSAAATIARGETDAQNRAPGGSVPTGAGGPHILVIGDREEDGAILRQALDSLDVQIDWVPNEAAAWDRLAVQHYDLLVVLLPLAETDSEAVCRRLRAADSRRPIMLLATARAAATEEHVLAGFEAGADAFLVAPIHAEELRMRVLALLRRSGAVFRPATPGVREGPEAEMSTPAVGTSTRRAGRIGLGTSLTAMQRSLRTVAGNISRRGRVVVAAALIMAGVAGDRAFQATQPPAATAETVAAATTVQTTTQATSSSLDAATQRAFAIASPSVVYVNNVGVGTGSGVIYDSTGDIVTNAHVVANAQSLRVTLSSGKTYTARIVGTDTADDLAVIHINATGLKAAHFATAGSYAVAQTVLAIGNPLDLQQSVTSGLISALNRTVQESNGAYLPNAIQTSAPINPGNSGGALVDLAGEVVGIPTLEATDPQNNNGGAAQGIGFAVPSSRVTYIAHQLIATGTVAHTGRAYLGVAATDAQQTQGQGQAFFGQGGVSTSSVAGALVTGVSGPAAQAGVQQGDVITAVNGTSITGEADLLAALAQQKPGATVVLALNRNGSTLSVRVRLGELSASA